MKNLLYTLLFIPLTLFEQDYYSLNLDGVGDFTPVHVYQVKFGTTLINYTYPIIG